MRKVKVPGNRILIRLKKLEKKETFEGSMIVRADLTDSRHKLEQEAIYEGYVVGVGEDAYSEYDTPWCRLGDLVQISRYSGCLVDNIEEGYVYRMVNDIDIHAVFEGEEDVRRN